MLRRSMPWLVLPSILGFQLVPNAVAQADPNLSISMRAKPSVVRIMTACHAKSKYKGEDFSYASGAIGTGFFISSNGYIVTNYHVVQAFVKDGCKDLIVRNLVEQITGQKDVEKALKSDKYRDEVEHIRDFVDKNLKETPATDGQATSSDGETFKIGGKVILPNGDRLDFEIVEKGVAQGGGGKDVAVIKIPIQNAPTLSFAHDDPTAIKLQDRVVVIGYPSSADLSSNSDYYLDFLNSVAENQKNSVKKSLGQASVVDGRISNPYKTLDNDTPVLQVDALVAEGSSGSPVLDENGQVIGMITFNSVDFSRSGNIPFAVPVTTIMEYVRRSGAAYNQRSSTDLLYQEGLERYKNEDYAGAKAKFEAVASNFKPHSESERLIQETNEKIAKRWTDQNYLPWLWALGGTLLAVTVAVRLRKMSFLKPRRDDVDDLSGNKTDEYFSDSVSNTDRTAGHHSINGQYNEFVSRRQPDTSSMPIGMLIPNRTVMSIAQPILKLENSHGRTHEFNLCKKFHKLGRDRTWADLDLPEAGWEIISKRHAVLKQDGENDDYIIFDGASEGANRSTNQIYIDGAPIPEEGQRLKHGMCLLVGRDPKAQIKIEYINPREIPPSVHQNGAKPSSPKSSDHSSERSHQNGRNSRNNSHNQI
jgi:hypothetical protein